MVELLATEGGRRRLATMLAEPLRIRTRYLRENPEDITAVQNLARSMRLGAEVLDMSPTLESLRLLLVAAFNTLVQGESLGLGDPVLAASCSVCLGSSNCNECVYGVASELLPCRRCNGTGICPGCPVRRAEIQVRTRFDRI